VTPIYNLLRKAKHLWMTLWPLWTLLAFSGLAAVRSLPVGYVRAALAVPILLLAPGSLTFGAAFSQHARPRGLPYLCYAGLLGAIWSVFASLVLYALGYLITADTTYFALLIASTALAIAAGARLLLSRPGRGRRVAPKPEISATDLSAAEIHDAKSPTRAAQGAAFSAVGAVIAGVGLLSGGLYAYDRLPHPAPVGYTWMAWAGPPVEGAIAVGSSGTNIHFQITHHQAVGAKFRLSAAWLGSPSKPLAKPLTLNIGPDKTFGDTLFIPPLPNGCTYRIVITLTALTKRPQSWTINADVHDPGKSTKTCR
jgi:hypothetical protein